MTKTRERMREEEEEEERAAEADRYLCQGRTCWCCNRGAGPRPWCNDQLAAPGTRIWWERVTVSGESRSDWFLGSATPATDTSAPGSGRVNQLPFIFPQISLSHSIGILTLNHVNCISFSLSHDSTRGEVEVSGNS